VDLVKQIDAELDKLEREVAKLEHARAILLEDGDNEVWFKRPEHLSADENRERVADFLRRVGQAPRVEILQATGIPRGSLNAALDALQSDDLIEREENQGSGGVTIVWTGERSEQARSESKSSVAA
jgi:hypothetical protein